MKLKQPKSGSPRPFQTWYFVRGNSGVRPDKIGHATTRIGAVLAATKKLRTSDVDGRQGRTAEFYRVEIYDETHCRCNTVVRTRKDVQITGYY